jgi:transcriptional regulator with XRE-family HTH domain
MPQPLDPGRVASLLDLKIRGSGLTLREVSRRIGRPEDYLSRLLKRRRKVDVGTLYAVLEVLGVPPSEFFAELKRSGEGEAAPAERDPDELLLGTISRGELFGEIHRVVERELARRCLEPPGGSGGPGDDDGSPGSGPQGDDGDEP